MRFKPIVLTVPLIVVVVSPVLATSDGAKRRLVPHSATELAAKIDGFIEADLSSRGIEPAPLASDAEFHRRVYLDLAGRIPTETEVRTFLANTAPERRAQLVNALLESPYYVQHMTNTWQTVLAPRAGNSQADFRNWLAAQVQQNAPYDSMVRDLLTVPIHDIGYGNGANYITKDFDPDFKKPVPFDPILVTPNPGKVKPTPKIKVDVLEPVELDVKLLKQLALNIQVSPAAFFFEANEYKPENLAASVARRFLGVRLECAQCHNHPFSSWTRKQFWELAAFFTDVQPPAVNLYTTKNPKASVEQVTFVVQGTGQPAGRAITIPGTDKVVQARFPDGQSPVWKNNVNSVQTLADWLTSPSNPYFARAAANRLWAHFFGIGIIDPVDDEPSEDNPASHPELLAELTAQFVASKYDVKYLIRAITASRAYQRTSAASHVSQNAPRLFARMAVKGLTGEQVFDSLALATGFQDPSGHQPGVIVPNTPRGDFLLLFSNQDKQTETQTSILQALTLMNGKLVADATSVTGSLRLATLLSGAGTNAEKLESLYLGTLSRLPRAQEAERLLQYLDSQGDARQALADIFWALLNSAEFRFNH
jgi:hypothetical protein